MCLPSAVSTAALASCIMLGQKDLHVPLMLLLLRVKIIMLVAVPTHNREKTYARHLVDVLYIHIILCSVCDE